MNKLNIFCLKLLILIFLKQGRIIVLFYSYTIFEIQSKIGFKPKLLTNKIMNLFIVAILQGLKLDTKKIFLIPVCENDHELSWSDNLFSKAFQQN